MKTGNYLLNKILGAPEEINGRGRCPTYLYRWFVCRTRWFKVYLHKFVDDDWSLDLHDHPKRFISVGLKGSYWEWTPDSAITGLGTVAKKYTAPWIRTFPAEHIHRLTIPKGSTCWTLVIVLRGTREWGFWHLSRFIPWKDYVDGKDSATADQMKACP
jgi:hypothetical protein